MSDNPKLIHQEFEDKQQVIGSSPSFLLRYGITFVFIGVMVLVILGSIIRYPDRVSAPLIIINEQPPTRVISKISGTVRLLVENSETVSKGQLLGYIGDAYHYQDILKVDSIIKLGNFQYLFLADVNLGPLQSTFSELALLRAQIDELEEGQQFKSQQHLLEIQLLSEKKLKLSLTSRLEILDGKLKLALEEYNRNQQLLNNGSISKVVFEQSELRYLDARFDLVNAQSDLERAKANILSLKNQITSSKLSYETALSASQRRYSLQQKEFIAKLEEWKNNFLLFAPQTGVVSLTSINYSGEIVSINSEVLSVSPNVEIPNLNGILSVSGGSSGKIKIGMKSIIRLEGYPHQEFGSLTGEVTKVAQVPGNQGYQINIEIPNSTTTYGIHIPLRHEMLGTALIITEDRTILDRIFDVLKDAFRNQ